jgi:hypothetical protein
MIMKLGYLPTDVSALVTAMLWLSGGVSRTGRWQGSALRGLMHIVDQRVFDLPGCCAPRGGWSRDPGAAPPTHPPRTEVATVVALQHLAQSCNKFTGYAARKSPDHGGFSPELQALEPNPGGFLTAHKVHLPSRLAGIHTDQGDPACPSLGTTPTIVMRRFRS